MKKQKIDTRCKITYYDGVMSDNHPTLFKNKIFRDENQAIKFRDRILKLHKEENPKYYFIEYLEDMDENDR